MATTGYTLWMLLALVAACEGGDPLGQGADGCLHRDLSDWCRHTEDGPTDGADCDLPVFEAGPEAYRCGSYDEVGSGPNLSGSSMFFDHGTGELVAVQYWTDVAVYCGSFSYWYGERVDCQRTCSYDPEETDPPPCP